MTWGELKDVIEGRGVTDDTEIRCIDVSSAWWDMDISLGKQPELDIIATEDGVLIF